MVFIKYRIAGNFRGRELSRFSGKKIFAEKNFAHCSLVSLPNDATPPTFAEKTLQIATNLKIHESFLPRKFPAILTHASVRTDTHTHMHMYTIYAHLHTYTHAHTPLQTYTYAYV